MLMQTSDDKIQPRAAEVAIFNWEALHHLRLDSLVLPADWNSIPTTEWKQAKRATAYKLVLSAIQNSRVMNMLSAHNRIIPFK